MRLLALDPGIRGCGVALFADGFLERAAYVKNAVTRGDALVAVVAMQREVTSWVACNYTLAAERMQVYTQGSRSGDPNDLIALAAIVGAVAAASTYERTWYLPREWKGTLPKGDAFEARVLERLNENERSKIQTHGALTHNVFDAIGIGLFHLGRFNRKRVIPR